LYTRAAVQLFHPRLYPEIDTNSAFHSVFATSTNVAAIFSVISREKTCLTIFFEFWKHTSVFGLHILSITVGLRSSQLFIIAQYATAIWIGVTSNHNQKLLFKNLAVETVLTDSTNHSSSHANSILVNQPNHNFSR